MSMIISPASQLWTRCCCSMLARPSPPSVKPKLPREVQPDIDTLGAGNVTYTYCYCTRWQPCILQIRIRRIAPKTPLDAQPIYTTSHLLPTLSQTLTNGLPHGAFNLLSFVSSGFPLSAFSAVCSSGFASFLPFFLSAISLSLTAASRSLIRCSSASTMSRH